MRDRPDLADGADCQLYAYAVLRRFGLRPPALRSGELWADTETTLKVRQPHPLDLLLFNATEDPWGAHVGVWVGRGHSPGAFGEGDLQAETGGGRVLHLCAEVGLPAVWGMEKFQVRDRYRVLVGIKRVVRPSPFVPARIPLDADH